MLSSIGTESKALGVHVQLGPVGGPLGKIPVVRKSRKHERSGMLKSKIGRAELGRLLE